MSKKLTKKLYESLQAKLDVATAAITGKKAAGTGKDKGGKDTGKAKGAKKKGGGRKGSKKGAAAPAASVVARPRKGKAPSPAEANLQRNVSLLKKLGSHRTQDAVLRKVGGGGWCSMHWWDLLGRFVDRTSPGHAYTQVMASR